VGTLTLTLLIDRRQQDASFPEDSAMTLSILMCGLMACALAVLVGALVVEARAGRVNVSLRAHLAAPVARQRHGRVSCGPDCPQRVAGSSLAARRAARSRWRAAPCSRRPWAA
jgi:hypothetical protein